MTAFPGKGRRRWFQYSLRSLLAVMLVVCLLLGHVANRGRQQRQAVARIEQRDGYVGYDWEPESALWITRHLPVWDSKEPAREPPGPKWLRDLMGDEYFQEVVCVRLQGPATNDDLALIADLDEVRILMLDGSSGVSDRGLEHVGKLHELDTLWLGGTSITDGGLRHLCGLRKLERLDLQVAGITDAGTVHLESLKSLEDLALYGTQIGDPGMQRIRKLDNLRFLGLSGTRVSDASVSALSALGNLEQLNLERTRISTAGVEALRKALPNCTITVLEVKSH